jgi:hypothetical protein
LQLPTKESTKTALAPSFCVITVNSDRYIAHAFKTFNLTTKYFLKKLHGNYDPAPVRNGCLTYSIYKKLNRSFKANTLFSLYSTPGSVEPRRHWCPPPPALPPAQGAPLGALMGASRRVALPWFAKSLAGNPALSTEMGRYIPRATSIRHYPCNSR